MKKPSEVPVRDDEVKSLKLRVANLERTSAALSARMLTLFGPAPKPVDVSAVGAVGAVRPAITPAAR